MIVNNYYINDRKEGWKQLEKSEISPNILESKMQGNFTEILPNILENKTQGNFSEISPEKPHLGDFNTQSGVKEEVKNLDRDRRNTTQAKAEPRIFYGEEAEVQNMSSPPTYNPNYPPPNRFLGNQETAAMLNCIIGGESSL